MMYSYKNNFRVLLVSLSLMLSRALGAALTHLPGFEGPLPFYLETGYVEVDEVNGVEIFYYFIKSERKPEEDPLLVWLTGGPGCSGFSGLVFEIGPLKFDVAGYSEGLPSLVYHPYSWTKVSNIIFLDSPVGTGFSYSRSSQGYETGDFKSAAGVYKFIRKWLIDHPEFLANPLYIGGDSYSGFIVPIVALEIANDNQESDDARYNLKGYLVGNPSTDSRFDGGAKYPYAHGMGLISDELYEGSIRDWKRCNHDLSYTQHVESSIPYHYNLTTRGYRALVYSGDHDMVIPNVGTRAWIRTLNFSIVDHWRPWSVNGQVAGAEDILHQSTSHKNV